VSNASKSQSYRHFHFREFSRGRYLAGAIYAASDGIITTFAIVTGATGALLASAAVLILGAVSLLANGFSMAAGNYLGARSEVEYFNKERKRELWEIKHLSEDEKEEVRNILLSRGVGTDLADKFTELITSNKTLWIDFMMTEELGSAPEENISPWKSALVTFFSFLAAGLAPLAFFVVSLAFVANSRFIFFIATALSLFTVGVIRARINKLSLLRNGFEILLVGGVAAAVAYGVGFILKSALL